jgi:citrate lyase subunit beta/citryl-CoA lyase
MRAMPALRSLLFVPGNKERMLVKAAGLAPDVLLPDMEDSVPDAQKAAARETVCAFLPKLASHRAAIVPRVNALGTPWAEEDLAAVVGPHVYGVSIGKIRTAGDLSDVSELIARQELRQGLPVGTIKLIPWLETAQAIVHCYAICTASARIAAVAFGAEDYTHDLGVERLDDESQLAFARATVCTAARAAGVPALETPYFKLGDLEGLHSSSLAAKHIGFKGRFAIHPEQIEPINECFSPSAAELEQARRVVAAYEAAEARGRGSTSLDGRVIDVPVVKRARAVLALAGKD